MFQTSISNFDYGFVISVQASIHWKRHLQVKKLETFYGEDAYSHHNILCVTAADCKSPWELCNHKELNPLKLETKSETARTRTKV